MKTYSLHPDSIRQLFNAIAPRYDFLNHLLSLRRDIAWRRSAVRALRGIEGRFLDIATGTGDVAIEIVRQGNGRRSIWGIDFSWPMLKKAQDKLLRHGLGGAIALAQADALTLPFRDSTFAATIMAFGLRNIPEKERALLEMIRVTSEGGRIVILEFTFPKAGLFRALYPIYFMKVLPWVGGIISGDRGAYGYLPQSVLHFPSATDYLSLMRKAGLTDLRSWTLTFGIAHLLVGTKKNR
jgi:demethylmenaquinone methyltransferase/2-methoxy-6-polyprenyl-1,4-benzoquinol methylase